MALPQRCKKCRCYIAPQLTRCPRCNTTVPAPTVVPSEDHAAMRAAEDGKVPTLNARKMRWVPSVFTGQAYERTLTALKRQLGRAETPRQRNAIRSEIRACKAVLTRAMDRAGAWSNEFFRTKHTSIPVLVSPKGHRYVVAPRDGRADLIILNRKRAAFTTTRLQRFEKSRYARYVKDEAKDARVQQRRKVAKQQRRKRIPPTTLS